MNSISIQHTKDGSNKKRDNIKINGKSFGSVPISTK